MRGHHLDEAVQAGSRRRSLTEQKVARMAREGPVTAVREAADVASPPLVTLAATGAADGDTRDPPWPAARAMCSHSLDSSSLIRTAGHALQALIQRLKGETSLPSLSCT